MDSNKNTTKYVVANWKMKLNSQEVATWANEWQAMPQREGAVEVIVAPTSVHMHLLESLKKLGVRVGAQDVAQYKAGAHTGDVSTAQIKDFCTYAIVGHSERKEPTEVVVQKRDACLEYGITPIVCFTDPSKAAVVYKEGALIAWEDPNNISVGGQFRDKNPREVENGVNRIAQLVPETAPILYGGSVNRQNIGELVNIQRLSGVLVGSASLDTQHFYDLVSAYAPS
jgi:triosephosphate isomerase (TIM)